jgi:hypothetical protein
MMYGYLSSGRFYVESVPIPTRGTDPTRTLFSWRRHHAFAF